MSSSEEETPVIPDVEQGAASLAVTDENIKQGTRLTGTVQSIHGDDMLIDFGLRYSGVLSRRQFGLRKQPMQGEPIEVIVNRIDESEGLMHVNLPTAGAKVRGGWEEISVDQVVECVVNQTNKGGLEVSVGSLRGFMPASQVELGYVSDLNVYVGQKFQAHVTEVNPKRRKLVLSRRKLLEESREQTEKDVFGKIAPGQTYEGRVKTLKDYGAFIDIGGVDGLLHVGQIGWSRINHPSEVLSEGQMIEVKVLSVDQEKKKIGLGMRQMTQNPWRTAEEKYAPNSVVSGKVTRIEGFGAFVELEPGIEGLVHISELDHKRVKTVHEVLRVGQAVDVQVIEVNPSKKRISLSLKALKEKPEDDSSIAEDVPVVQHISPESLKGGIGEPTGGKLFGDPSKFGR
ncbi:MAG: S1 RNA-binding domain-containing protein [Planctomycetaceae bacterium]